MAADKKSRGKKPELGKSKPAEKKEGWDEVAEASWESFPASDPPPWTTTRPAKKADNAK